MRIAIHFTIDVDADEWATEYGITKDEVREDVRRYIEDNVREDFSDRGFLTESTER